ncbi:hypothetical protein CS062_02110 [Roseateles chitinivorans]|uniref:DUF2383 domain-containing protein n=1 Tax=Roseateles chitinivorans TaxID=2917965 RepID=A0A2G9CFA8_9BURK|nr:hypothetical protein [Roseateles chitinivorans]PIM55012.1 hypothetical protein CS062_02110 [Roseateles chitinivorans]
MTTQRCMLAARAARSDGGVPIDDDACQRLRGLWVRVLVQLRQVEEACATPGAQQQLRRIGVRRPDVLVDGLAGEFRRTHQLAVMGCCLPPTIEALGPGTVVSRLPPRDEDRLDRGFEALSASYAELLDRLAPPLGSHRHNWLESRVRVHLARAEALRHAL